MAKIDVEIEHDEIENEYGKMVESVRAVCSECGHTTESFGTGESSIKRCLYLLREECPQGENNFYACDEV